MGDGWWIPGARKDRDARGSRGSAEKKVQPH
jgi:hypothetical protein